MFMKPIAIVILETLGLMLAKHKSQRHTNDVKGKGEGDHHIIILLIRDNCRLSL